MPRKCNPKEKEEAIQRINKGEISVTNLVEEYKNKDITISNKSVYRWLQQSRTKAEEPTPEEKKINRLEEELKKVKRTLSETEVALERANIRLSKNGSVKAYKEIKRIMGEKSKFERDTVTKLCEQHYVSRGAFYSWLEDEWVFDGFVVNTRQFQLCIAFVFDSRKSCIIAHYVEFTFNEELAKKILSQYISKRKIQTPLIIHTPRLRWSAKRWLDFLGLQKLTVNDILIQPNSSWSKQTIFKHSNEKQYKKKEEVKNDIIEHFKDKQYETNEGARRAVIEYLNSLEKK